MISRLERCVDIIAKNRVYLFVDIKGDLNLQLDTEDTMYYQGERFVKYSDANMLAIETAKSVHVLHDWFFTWSGAMEFVKRQKSVNPALSTVLDVSMRKLPFFGYVVLRTML